MPKSSTGPDYPRLNTGMGDVVHQSCMDYVLGSDHVCYVSQLDSIIYHIVDFNSGSRNMFQGA
jgi:hypothetical protein